MEIPAREALEKRLGAVYRLDDSFASLWAIERILETVRRVPRWANHVGWLKTYMADFFSVAFSEMGIAFARTGNRFECRNIRYSFSTDEDIPRLMQPAAKQPMFYALSSLGWPVMNYGALPYYAFATLAQNQEWASAEHDMIGRLRDHLDRVVPWLTNNSLHGLTLPPGLHEDEARMLVSALVWPPLGFQMNEKGEFNLRKLAERVQQVKDQNAVRPFLQMLASSQNYFLRLPAAEYAKTHGLKPQSQNEALAYREACTLFETPMTPSLEASVARLLPDDEDMLDGRNDALYIEYGESYERGDMAAALDVLDQLVQHSPANAMFLCSRGDILTNLNRNDEALADFDASIRLNPQYWQARINRGVLHSRASRFGLADTDFFEAAKIRYGNADTRNNLLCNYFFRLDAG